MKILLTALNAKFIHSSLAIRSLKAYCKDINNIDIREFTINHDKDFIIRELFGCKPDAIGFSCYIWNINIILEIASNIKKVLPNTFIFLGGPEVSFDSQKLLSKFSFIDLIIRGEGEKVFYNLAKALINKNTFSNIKGITYKKGNEILYNPPETEIMPDEIPFSNFDLSETKNRIIYYESQRGCPYNCQFCLSSTENSLRFLSLERVKKDLYFFIKNNVKQVKFVDRSFNCNKKHAHDIWQYIIENDNGFTNFHMEIEAHTLEDSEIEFLNTARKGLFQFEIGVQSTNPKTLSAVKRNGDFETLKDKIKKIKSNGNIHIHLDLIAGLPYEDYKSFKNSFNDVYSLRPEQLQLGFLKLLKGSGLREDADKYGIVYKNNAPYEVLYTNDIDFEHMLKIKGIEEIVELYYNSFKIPNTEKYVCSLFKTPFDFYEQLYNYWYKNGMHKINHSRQEIYNIFYEFCVYCNFSYETKLIIAELIKFDILLLDNIKTAPYFAPFKTDDEYKHKKRTFFNNLENVKEYIPNLSGYTPSQLSRMCHIEHFNYDVTLDKPKLKNTDILFNYSNRSIITNHAQYFKINI